MHALLSHGEKPRPELGSQCGPGGRRREEGAGRTPRSHQRRGREGQKAAHSNPPNRCISLCKMGTAIVLPLCWGKKNTRTTEGYSQGRRDTRTALPPLAPFPVFYSRWGEIEPARVCAHCPEKPGRRSGSSPGESWRPRERNRLPHQLLLLSQHHGHQGRRDSISRVSLWLASPQEASDVKGGRHRGRRAAQGKGSGCRDGSSRGWSE